MLNLGLFMMPIHPAGKDLGKSLREDQELVLLADKLNFSESLDGRTLQVPSVNLCPHL